MTCLAIDSNSKRFQFLYTKNPHAAKGFSAVLKHFINFPIIFQVMNLNINESTVCEASAQVLVSQ